MQTLVFPMQTGEPLIFNEGAYTSKITSMLAFYAYLILGMITILFRNLEEMITIPKPLTLPITPVGQMLENIVGILSSN